MAKRVMIAVVWFVIGVGLCQVSFAFASWVLQVPVVLGLNVFTLLSATFFFILLTTGIMVWRGYFQNKRCG